MLPKTCFMLVTTEYIGYASKFLESCTNNSLHNLSRNCRSRVFCKKRVLKDFVKFGGKTNLKESLAQVFSCTGVFSPPVAASVFCTMPQPTL